MTRSIVVDIIGNASNFNSATAQAIQKTETLGGKLKTVGKGMVIGAGIGAFNLLASAIDVGIGKLGEAREAFLADAASADLLAQALKNNIPGWDGNTAGVEAYATAQAKLGFTDDEVRDSIGQLIGVTHDLSEAQKLNSLAQDLARAKGIDLATASDIVTKAYQGNGKALKALGIDTSEASGAAGLLAAIQQNASGAAETWAGSQGKAAVANVAVGEAMEKVGAVVDKVAQVAIPILADALTYLVDHLGKVWDAVQPVVSVLVDTLGPAFKWIAEMAAQYFGVVIAVIRGVAPVFASVFSIIAGIYKAIFNTIIRGINFVIGLINRIQVPAFEFGPVKFDGWGGVNLGKIPLLHTGGIVPGSPGSDQLAILQAGERVIPRGGGGGMIVVNIESFIGSDRDIDRFTDRIAQRLALLR